MRGGMTAAAVVLAAVGAASARPTYTAFGPVAVPDAGLGDCLSSPPGAPATIDIIVGDSFTIGNAQVGVHILHTWQADLKFTLTKVGSGTTVTLVDRAGNPATACGFNEFDYGTTAVLFNLTDAAAMTYDVPGVAFPGIFQVSGDWKPESPLAAFNGLNSAGTWRLSVNDNANADVGTIMVFSLVLDGSGCYPDCNLSGNLTVADFGCFQGKYVLGDMYADCNASGTLTVADFGCYQGKYVLGCPP
ncbi:MAG: proprotein convertase P-domain-containing protein [Phycisphaerales bacterium]